MDFVVSKLAMAVCALLVVSALGGVFESGFLFSEVDELESILRDLCATMEGAVLSGCESTTKWEVPFLADGGCIEPVKCALHEPCGRFDRRNSGPEFMHNVCE